MKLFTKFTVTACLLLFGSSALSIAQSTETYGAALDGAILKWDVYTPTNPGPWAAVLVIHGGGFKGGSRKGGELSTCAQDLANAGYLALAIEYRLAPPGSILGQTSSGQGAAQYEDVEMAVRADRADPRANGQVGAVGGSAGGTHATWVALTPDPASRVNVAVSLSGAHDFTDFRPDPNIAAFRKNVTNLVAVSNPPSPEELATLGFYSPVTNVDATVAPLFLVNSARDSMPFTQLADMTDKLLSLGLDTFETLTLPGAGHAFANWPGARELALAFLAQGFGGVTEPPAPPTITRQPRSRVVPTGERATFAVAATGLELLYQWFRDGGAIEGATASTYVTPPTTPVDDGALFSVSVSNGAGNAMSDPAHLTVK